jgi:hypothetical protein
MHAGQTPLHYAPASVGCLMYPAFLRGAVLDAEGELHVDAGTDAARSRRHWLTLVRRVVARLLDR